MADEEGKVHDARQAVARELNAFESDIWPAFKKRGFGSMGEAFIAYLLMQLVSAAAETALDPPLVTSVARPQSAREALDRMIAVDARIAAGTGTVVVG